MLESAGRAEARVITSGPDQDVDKIEFMFQQAIGCARRSIKIVTPYFLPEDRLFMALVVGGDARVSGSRW